MYSLAILPKLIPSCNPSYGCKMVRVAIAADLDAILFRRQIFFFNCDMVTKIIWIAWENLEWVIKCVYKYIYIYVIYKLQVIPVMIWFSLWSNFLGYILNSLNFQVSTAAPSPPHPDESRLPRFGATRRPGGLAKRTKLKLRIQWILHQWWHSSNM